MKLNIKIIGWIIIVAYAIISVFLGLSFKSLYYWIGLLSLAIIITIIENAIN